MPHVATVGTATWTTNQATTLDVTLTGNVPVGHTLLATVASQALSAQDGPFTATDAKGNTWVERGHAFKSGSVQTSILSCAVTTALSVGDKITFAHNPGVNMWAVDVEQFDDAEGFDLSASATGNSAAMAVAGGTGAQDSELVFGGFGYNGSESAYSAGSGFTASTPVQAASTTWRNVVSQWKYVTTGGARSSDGSSAASGAWAGVLAAFKVTPAGGGQLTADAGEPQTGVEPWTTVTLTGTHTGGTNVTHRWRQISGAPVTLSATNTATVTFTAPGTINGSSLVFGYTVSQSGWQTSPEATVQIDVLSSVVRAVIDGAEVPCRMSAIQS
jgi:hypothetical protein